MVEVIISLGSNLGNRQDNLEQAIRLINNQVGLVSQKSSIYETEPWGFSSFNNFLNQVIECKSELNPEEVLLQLLRIEESLGRQRHSQSYADRTIDLDILFFGDLIVKNDELTIPHPKLTERAFVLEPLTEILPELNHPELNQSIGVIYSNLKNR